MIADATTQSPGRRSGANPPATPKLMILRQPALMASWSKSAVSRPRQTTSTPGPAAIRASKASPTSAITDRCDRSLRSSALAAPRPSTSMSGLLQVSLQASRQASFQPWRHPDCCGETLKVGHDQENLLVIIGSRVGNRSIIACRPTETVYRRGAMLRALSLSRSIACEPVTPPQFPARQKYQGAIAPQCVGPKRRRISRKHNHRDQDILTEPVHLLTKRPRARRRDLFKTEAADEAHQLGAALRGLKAHIGANRNDIVVLAAAFEKIGQLPQ